MPNFAHEVPWLLFLPFVIFAAVAGGAGLVHLAVQIEVRFSARPALRETIAGSLRGEAAAVVSFVQQLSPVQTLLGEAQAVSDDGLSRLLPRAGLAGSPGADRSAACLNGVSPVAATVEA